MDSLAVLREYVSTGRLDAVSVDGDRINFGEQYSFNRVQPTSFKSKDALVTLQQALACALHVDALPYMQYSNRNKLKAVHVEDRAVRAAEPVWWRVTP